MLVFSYIYTTIKSNFKDLTENLATAEKMARKSKENEYDKLSVELISFEKVGFRKYMVIFKTVGYLK